MPDSKTTHTARTWLQTGQAPKERAGEVIRAAALLSGQLPAMAAALQPPLSVDVEMALLLEAESKAQWGFVELLSTSAGNKVVAKQAKKLIFRAKQRGVAVADKPVVRAGISLAARPEPLPSHASTFDVEGNQLVMLGGWSAGDGAWCLAGFVHETDGLHSAYFMPHLSRTAHREILDKMRASFKGAMTEVPDGFAGGRLRWGTDVRDARGQTWEGDQPETRRVLSDAEPLTEIEFSLGPDEESALDARLSAEDVSCAIALDLLSNKSVRLAAAKALESELAAAQATKAETEALTEARASFVKQWFDGNRRALIAGRMEIDAWLRHQMQDTQGMMAALALARLLRDTSRQVTEAPLFRQAMRTGLSYAALSLLVRSGDAR